MIRKELSFSIHSKFIGGSDHNEEALEENLKASAALGDDGFSFRSNDIEMMKENNGEKDDTGEGIRQSNFGEMDTGDLSDPSFLKNYARFLESKGELLKAEEFYYRATILDPKDGELLCRFAALIWELHHDRDQALAYFENAIVAAPGDSDILAAYASFMWNIDEEDDEVDDWNDTQEKYMMTKDSNEEIKPIIPPLHLAMGLGVDMPGFSSDDLTHLEEDETANIEEYYRRMLEENSSNPLYLNDYSRFLHQFKENLQEAEEYYSGRVQNGFSNGQIMAQYANVVWQLHRNAEKADTLFNLAIQTIPRDSNLLASYAKFLWEIEDEQEDSFEEALKQPAEGLEELYSHAKLDDPSNVERNSQYANILWQVHGDKDRAEVYFKRAIETGPEDSNVLASYAKFLWDIAEEDEDSSE